MERHELRFPVMGTEAHLTVLGTGPAALARARARLEWLEARWSRFRVDSEIAELNRAGGRPVVVSAETFDLIASAVGAWTATGGAFDPTVGQTMARAGYDRPRQRWDTDWRAGAEHVACPTPAGVVLDPYPRSVTVPAGVALDLGGIAKGAAADLVAGELLDGGAEGCCVNLGGDLRVAGRPPGPRGWRIDIEVEPDRPGRSTEVVATLGLAEGAACTTTSRRRRWQGPHGPEHHLRDPATGRPLTTGATTVTVVAWRAIQAEVLATLAFAAGPVAGPGLVEATGATGLIVDSVGEVATMAGLQPFLDAGRPPGDPASPSAMLAG